MRRVRPVVVAVAALCLAGPANALLADLPLLSAPYQGWSQQAVGETSTAEFGMAIDSRGRAHFAVHRTDVGITYIRPDVGWVQEDVFPAGRRPDIAIDSSGNPHIVYAIYDTPQTGYATKTNSGWTTQTLDAADGGGYNRIRIDSAGRIHVVYAGGSGASGIWYAVSSGGSWTKQQITTGQTFGLGFDLDANGRAHVVLATSSLILRYATNAQGAWSLSTIPTSGAWPDLAVDTLDNPHIAFEMLSGRLGYAKLASGVWTVETADPANPTGDFASIDTDSMDRPHIAYGDFYNGDSPLGGKARYATRLSDGSWAREIVGPIGYSKWKPELEVDGEDFPRVGYNLFETQVFTTYPEKLMLAEPIARTIVPYGVLP